jgi:hypothetical protein
MSKPGLNGNLQGASTSAERSGYPAALQIALEQLAAGLRQHGDASLACLFEDKEGYPKIIVALEKLCKCAVEFDQLREGDPKAMPGTKGISKETDAQLTSKLQGL